MTHPSSSMSGLASEPSVPGPNSLPVGGDSAPWTDTEEMGLPAQPAVAFNANPPNKAADQLPTIGHIGRYALKYQIGEGGLGRVRPAAVAPDRHQDPEPRDRG
jgi:hypothetical protein